MYEMRLSKTFSSTFYTFNHLSINLNFRAKNDKNSTGTDRVVLDMNLTLKIQKWQKNRESLFTFKLSNADLPSI